MEKYFYIYFSLQARTESRKTSNSTCLRECVLLYMIIAIVLARPFQSVVYTFIKEDDIYIFDDDFHTFLFLTPEFYQ